MPNIKAAGNAVRDKKAPGEDFEQALATLKDPKAQFEQVTGALFNLAKRGAKKAVASSRNRSSHSRENKGSDDRALRRRTRSGMKAR